MGGFGRYWSCWCIRPGGSDPRSRTRTGSTRFRFHSAGHLVLPRFSRCVGCHSAIIVLNLAVTLSLAKTLWRGVPVGLWLALAGGAVLGFPFGIWIFGMASIEHLKLALGVVVIVFALATWFDVSILPARFKQGPKLSRMWSAFVGAVAGFMTTALGMPGPLVIVHLAGLSLEKDVVRATAITFLAFAYSIALIFHVTLVPMQRDLMVLAGVLVPVAAIGSWSGHVLSRRLGQRSFRHTVLALITASGVVTIISVLN